MPDEIAIYIAGKVKSNVRELEGSLVRLVAISSLRGVPISKMLAQEAMKNILDSRAARRADDGPHRPHRRRALQSDGRGNEVEEQFARDRRAAAGGDVPLQTIDRHSFPEIGREFGGKHHTTVMHSVDKIDTLIKDDRNFHREIQELIDNLCS